MVDLFTQEVPLASDERHIEHHKNCLGEEAKLNRLLYPNRNQQKREVDNYSIKEELPLFY